MVVQRIQQWKVILIHYWLNQANISADLDNIIKLINNIDPPLVEISKDKIDKYYNDKRTSKIKIFEKFKEEQNKKNKICIKEENQNKNEIIIQEEKKIILMKWKK